MKITPWAVLACLLLALPAWSHDGEDHGAPPPTVRQAVAPRAEAKSEDFELLLVLQPPALLIYLDAWASNAPVPGARLELSGNGVKGVATEIAPGVYQLAPANLGPGRHALTLSVETADSADLLAVQLEVPSAAPAPGTAPSPWPGLKWLGASALLLAGLAMLVGWWQNSDING